MESNLKHTFEVNNSKFKKGCFWCLASLTALLPNIVFAQELDTGG